MFDLKPRRDQATKPSELIQITGHQSLTLNARRAITILWHNAQLQGLEDGKNYVIEIDDLKPDNHKGYEMVEEAVEALMRTIIRIKKPDGEIERVAVLGGNNMSSPSRRAGVLTYRFDSGLIKILEDSTIWGKIALPILMALTSKYAVSLYEHVTQWTGLAHKTFQDYSLDEFRELLGIETGKYPAFGALNKHVIKPATLEINALAPFNITILPVKSGKKVTRIRISWWNKNNDEMAAAWQEVNRPKVGRRARISGQTDYVHEPMASQSRILREGRVEFQQSIRDTEE